MKNKQIDYEQLAADYARHRQAHPDVLLALIEAVSSVTTEECTQSVPDAERQSAPPASRVLEVGCGTGNYIIALQAQAGCACWGIDPSQEMLDKARSRTDKVTLRLGSAEQLDLDDGPFDLVFTVDVIHHLQDVRAYYERAWSLLAPGGRICTATDSEWIIRHRQPLSTYFPETVELELARYPRIAALRETMSEVGFDQLVEHTVECSYPLHDIQIYRDKAFSALHLISDEAFRRGIERVEADLESGPIRCTPRYTLLWGTKERQ